LNSNSKNFPCVGSKSKPAGAGAQRGRARPAVDHSYTVIVLPIGRSVSRTLTPGSSTVAYAMSVYGNRIVSRRGYRN
jgi:hypothetical protein